MSAVPVTLIGTITTPSSGAEGGGSKVEQCVIAGLISITGLHVGGGPIEPPPTMPPGIDRPPHPEHPIPPRPAHPIVLPPIEPGGPPIDIDAHPEHPIVLPPPPTGGVKPPPPEGGWGYSPEYGWGYFPNPDGGKPSPIHPPGSGMPPTPSHPDTGIPRPQPTKKA